MVTVLNLETFKIRQFLSFFNYSKIRKSRFFKKKRVANTNKKCQAVISQKKYRESLIAWYRHLSTCSLDLSEVRCKKQKLCEHKTDHNSGSWAPLEMKSSSLDRIFQAAFNSQCFEAWNLQNKAQKWRRQQKNRTWRKVETGKNRARKNEKF